MPQQTPMYSSPASSLDSRGRSIRSRDASLAPPLREHSSSSRISSPMSYGGPSVSSSSRSSSSRSQNYGYPPGGRPLGGRRGGAVSQSPRPRPQGPRPVRVFINEGMKMSPQMQDLWDLVSDLGWQTSRRIRVDARDRAFIEVIPGGSEIDQEFGLEEMEGLQCVVSVEH